MAANKGGKGGRQYGGGYRERYGNGQAPQQPAPQRAAGTGQADNPTLPTYDVWAVLTGPGADEHRGVIGAAWDNGDCIDIRLNAFVVLPAASGLKIKLYPRSASSRQVREGEAGAAGPPEHLDVVVRGGRVGMPTITSGPHPAAADPGGKAASPPSGDQVADHVPGPFKHGDYDAAGNTWNSHTGRWEPPADQVPELPDGPIGMEAIEEAGGNPHGAF